MNNHRKPYKAPDYERDWRSLERVAERVAESNRILERTIHEPIQAGDFQDWDNTPPQARSSHAAPKSVADKLSRQEKVARISSIFWLIVWSAVIVGLCCWAVWGILR